VRVHNCSTSKLTKSYSVNGRKTNTPIRVNFSAELVPGRKRRTRRADPSESPRIASPRGADRQSLWLLSVAAIAANPTPGSPT
jgi:hypothetical protein